MQPTKVLNEQPELPTTLKAILLNPGLLHLKLPPVSRYCENPSLEEKASSLLEADVPALLDRRRDPARRSLQAPDGQHKLLPKTGQPDCYSDNGCFKSDCNTMQNGNPRSKAHRPTQHLRPLVLYMQHVFTTHCNVVVADIITKGRTGTLRHQYKRHQSSKRSNIKAQESSQ
jgi:hypothetical protein